MKHMRNILSLLAVTLLLSACGGGGGGSGVPAGGGGGGGTGSAAKTATVAFSVVSTASLPAPVQGITLIAVLPAGTSVATNAGSHGISSSALTIGSGISDPNLLVYGTYSAAANKVKIGLASTNGTFRGGEFARLTVQLPSAVSLAAGDFTSANLPAFPLFQAAGDDGATHSVMDLSGKLRASLGVTFN